MESLTHILGWPVATPPPQKTHSEWHPAPDCCTSSANSFRDVYSLHVFWKCFKISSWFDTLMHLTCSQLWQCDSWRSYYRMPTETAGLLSVRWVRRNYSSLTYFGVLLAADGCIFQWKLKSIRFGDNCYQVTAWPHQWQVYFKFFNAAFLPLYVGLFTFHPNWIFFLH